MRAGIRKIKILEIPAPYPNMRKLVMAIIVITISATKRKCIMSGSIKTSVPEKDRIKRIYNMQCLRNESRLIRQGDECQ